MTGVDRYPFCSLPDDRVVGANASGVVIRDAYPVSPGHTLIISRRHVGSLFELRPSERIDLLALLDQARADLEPSCHPDGYNIGINDGPAAGQTVPHLHIHLIPRYRGDLPDPRGGVRWIFPGGFKSEAQHPSQWMEVEGRFQVRSATPISVDGS